MPETVRELLPSLPETKNLPIGYGRPKAIDQDMYKLSSLDRTYAALVNKLWHFGGSNESSQRFTKRCTQIFPNFCLLGPEGSPVSWSLMDHTGEMWMGATLPEYWGHGLVSHLLFVHIQALDKLGFPLYNHTEPIKSYRNLVTICIIYPCPMTGTSGTVGLCEAAMNPRQC